MMGIKRWKEIALKKYPPNEDEFVGIGEPIFKEQSEPAKDDGAAAAPKVKS